MYDRLLTQDLGSMILCSTYIEFNVYLAGISLNSPATNHPSPTPTRSSSLVHGGRSGPSFKKGKILSWVQLKASDWLAFCWLDLSIQSEILRPYQSKTIPFLKPGPHPERCYLHGEHPVLYIPIWLLCSMSMAEIRSVSCCTSCCIAANSSSFRVKSSNSFFVWSL